MSELSPRARELLESAALDEPTGADQARVRAAVFAQIGLPVPSDVGNTGAGSATSASGSTGGGAAIGAASTKAVAGLTAIKGLGVLALVAAVGGGAYVALERSGSDKPASARATQPSPSSAPAAPALSPPTPAVPEHEPDVAPPTTVVEPPQPRAASGSPARRGGGGAHRLRQGARANPAVRADTASPSPTRSTSANPTPSGEAVPRSSDEGDNADGADKAKDAQAALPSPGGDLRAEHDLLRRARSALRQGSTGEAMAAVTEHVKRFPSGVLTQERDVLRVLILCAQDRPAEARRRAVAFRTAYPGSPLLPRLAASCAKP